tara:strand:+ start:811 stop:1158 length:348 start_codon:yes stop_codon:yes gene_type:complete
MDEDDFGLEDLELEDDFSIINDQETNLTFSEEKITSPIMTVYEKVGVISRRVKMLDDGYKSTIEEIIKKEGIFRSYDIAMKEFELNALPPYYVKRVLPNNTYEIWEHSDFIYFPK